jgi:hypothetical protein
MSKPKTITIEHGSLLGRAVGDQAIVWNQTPIALPPNNELQPDLALLKPRREKFKPTRNY